MKKRVCSIAALLLLAVLIPSSVLAKSISYTPYQGYEYNQYDESTAAPVGYVPDAVYTGETMGLSLDLDAPGDMYYDGKDTVYILDSGHGRILQLDTAFHVTHIYDKFVTGEGEEKDITGARGLTLDGKGNFYIANTDHYEVLQIDRTGKVLQVITRPDEALTDTDAQFLATKVTVDNRNQLYVLVESINMGAFVFNEQGEFQHFFGSNPIVATAEVARDYLWKRFMTKEMRKGLARITPTVFSNFDVDAYGFLYTVTADKHTTARADMVRRLNYKGVNILKEDAVFGDLEWDRAFGLDSLYTSFTDVDIDQAGFINLLDTGRGRIFQYTVEGDLIAEFGSFSGQSGGFEQPTAIETIGDRVYVLDAGKKSVLSFVPSRYGASLRRAFLLMNGTDTAKTLEAWTDVLKMNTNSQYPYYGIGLVYDAQGRYPEAMEQFKLAGAHTEYSKALREYRKEFVGTYYIWLILGAALLIALVVILVRGVKKKLALVHGTAYSAMETKYLFPLYTLLHPSDGFDQFKSRKIYSLRLSILIVLAWFFLQTGAFFYTGYSFNLNRALDYQFWLTLFFSAGLFVLFVTANWSVCTLMNGKGSLKEIIAVCAYALLPYLFSTFLNILLSNILTEEEAAIMSLVGVIGVLWSGILLIVGLQSIHQYSFIGTIGSILLTLVGMAIICFLAMLFFALLQQAVNFIRSLIMELSLR